jgi:hypothetical protein
MCVTDVMLTNIQSQVVDRTRTPCSRNNCVSLREKYPYHELTMPESTKELCAPSLVESPAVGCSLPVSYESKVPLRLTRLSALLFGGESKLIKGILQDRLFRISKLSNRHAHRSLWTIRSIRILQLAHLMLARPISLLCAS